MIEEPTISVEELKRTIDNPKYDRWNKTSVGHATYILQKCVAEENLNPLNTIKKDLLVKLLTGYYNWANTNHIDIFYGNNPLIKHTSQTEKKTQEHMNRYHKGNPNLL